LSIYPSHENNAEIKLALNLLELLHTISGTLIIADLLPNGTPRA
jgi:hypothetical protein